MSGLERSSKDCAIPDTYPEIDKTVGILNDWKHMEQILRYLEELISFEGASGVGKFVIAFCEASLFHHCANWRKKPASSSPRNVRVLKIDVMLKTKHF